MRLQVGTSKNPYIERLTNFATYFRISSAISAPSKHMIKLMLQAEPKNRPKVNELAQHEFMLGYCPPSLPVSCLTMAPRFDKMETPGYAGARKPLLELNQGNGRFMLVCQV